MPLGAKRNLACAMGRGEFIAHWDDDDWSAPNRLSAQVAHLQAADADACGARELLHYRPRSGDAWLYRYPAKERAWVAGCTLLYRRSAWAQHAFPAIDVGEDNAFVWALPPGKIAAIPDLTFYVAILHAGNTGRKKLSDPRWRQWPLEDVRRVLGSDWDFYLGLRDGLCG